MQKKLKIYLKSVEIVERHLRGDVMGHHTIEMELVASIVVVELAKVNQNSALIYELSLSIFLTFEYLIRKQNQHMSYVSHYAYK